MMDLFIILAIIVLVVVAYLLWKRGPQQGSSNARQRPREAVKIAPKEKVEKQNPHDFLKLATAAKKAGNIDSALQIIDQAALLAGKSGWDFQEIKSIYNKKRHYLTLAKKWDELTESFQRWEKEADATPEQAFRQWNLGWVEAQKSQVAKARRDFQGRVLAEASSDWHFYQALRMQQRLEEYEENQVIEELRESVQAAGIDMDAKEITNMIRKHREDGSPAALKVEVQSLVEA